MAKPTDMRQLRPLDRAGDNNGDSPWQERIIEPETRQLAARAAEAAGLTLEDWIERAIRRSCALDGTLSATNAAAATAPAGAELAPESSLRLWRAAALLALPLLITAGIAYLATRPADIRGRAVVIELPRQPAAAIIATAPLPPALPGDKEPTDPAQLAQWLAPRAAAGDALAQYRLGALYAMGKGIERDYARAAPLLRASAEAGLAEAQFDLGVLLENGLGLAADPEAATGWYRKAAAQGSAEAALNLGYAAAKGLGVRKDLAEAARWFHRAAELGAPDGQYNLAYLYEHGGGVPKSLANAYLWYSIAAAQGDNGARDAAERLARDLSAKQLSDAKARATAIPAAASGER
jgi:localization factor PodJL